MPATRTSSVASRDTQVPPSTGAVVAVDVGGIWSVKSIVAGPGRFGETPLALERGMEVIAPRDVLRGERVFEHRPSVKAAADVQHAHLGKLGAEGNVALPHAPAARDVLGVGGAWILEQRLADIERSPGQTGEEIALEDGHSR